MPLVKKLNSPFWYYDFPFDGRRVRGSTRKKTKAAAAAVEAAVLTALEDGRKEPRHAGRKPTLREFSTRFLAWSRNSRTLRENTRKYYFYGWRLLSQTRLASMHLDQITAEVVDCTRFLRIVRDRKTGQLTDKVEPCSPNYTNQALRTLKVMLGMAVEWRELRARPKFAAVEAPGRDQVITEDAEILLQRELQRPSRYGSKVRGRQQAWLCLVILQDTGMRPDELFVMRIENLHFDRDCIWIPGGKTRNSRRFVGMSERMKTMLLEWTKGREGWVFPSKRAASGHLESISNSFRLAKQRAGIHPGIVLYSARHSYATHQMQATGNVFAVSKSMGHANIQSMTPYQHPDTMLLNATINKRNQDREQRRFELLTGQSQTPSQTSTAVH